MKQTRIIAAAMVTVIAVACTVAGPESVDTPSLSGQELTLTATLGEPETRTERASDGSVLWSPGDEISLFYGSGSTGGSRFTAQNTETAKTVNFTGTIGVITGGNNIAVEDTYFWAVYPYDAAASCDGSSITTTLPSVQTATAGTFADDLFPSMGRSQGLNMSFYNICGGIKLTVSEEGIKSVTLKSNSGEPIAGTISAAFDNGVPVVTGVAGGSDSITLEAPAGETFATGQAYYFVMVPTVFETGFTLTFSKGYAQAERVITSKATIKRSVFGTMNTPDAGLEWETLYVPIPDANFKAYMIQNFDTNGNGELDFDEAEAVRDIEVNTANIESVEGIEYCKNLFQLQCYAGRSWSEAEQKYVGAGLLSKLDVSQNTALARLYCEENQLTSLDVSQNTALTHLRCDYNKLTSLDVSANTALSSLDCGNNQLTSLDVSQNKALKRLDCSSNQLTSLDVSQNTALTRLFCSSTQLRGLDVSQNTALSSLDCGNNQLTSLDVSANTALSSLDCGNNQLTSLDVSQNPALTELRSDYNQLTSLDVSNTTLKTLCCSYNQLTSLDVSKNTALQSLECYSNQLTNLDVSRNTALKTLYCFSNLLTSLDVSQNTALTRLNCSPMNASNGQNLLGYLYIAQGQSIPNVTTDRNSSYVPSETIIMVAPETGGNEGSVEYPLIPISSIELPASLSIVIGESRTLTPVVLPENATNKSVTWNSSIPAVATVDSNGKVTAVSSGSTKITVIANDGSNLSAECVVRVYANTSLPASVGAIDLGLPSGLKWATMNVGATKPEEYGEYFAWGETQPKSDYNWETYWFELGSDDSGPFSKYVTDSSYGTVDNKTVLDPEDDAAHVNWGGSWRIPTDSEWTELRDNCTWTWTEQNGVSGRLVTGPNGNSVFLPAAGYMRNEELSNTGLRGYYWSSVLDSDSPAYASRFGFYSEKYYGYDSTRITGFSVRPVTE